MFAFVFGVFAGKKYLRFGDVRKNTWLVVKNTSHVFLKYVPYIFEISALYFLQS